MSKNQKHYEHWWKLANIVILAENFLIYFKRFEEFQWNFQETCDLW